MAKEKSEIDETLLGEFAIEADPNESLTVEGLLEAIKDAGLEVIIKDGRAVLREITGIKRVEESAKRTAEPEATSIPEEKLAPLKAKLAQLTQLVEQEGYTSADELGAGKQGRLLDKIDAKFINTMQLKNMITAGLIAIHRFGERHNWANPDRKSGSITVMDSREHHVEVQNGGLALHLPRSGEVLELSQLEVSQYVNWLKEGIVKHAENRSADGEAWEIEIDKAFLEGLQGVTKNTMPSGVESCHTAVIETFDGVKYKASFGREVWTEIHLEEAISLVGRVPEGEEDYYFLSDIDPGSSS